MIIMVKVAQNYGNTRHRKPQDRRLPCVFLSHVVMFFL